MQQYWKKPVHCLASLLCEELINRDIHAGKTAPRLTPQFILDQIRSTQYHIFPDTTVTICCLTLLNGYNVVGHSACISPSNFNVEIGMKVARENTVKEIWALEGYLMKEMLHTAGTLEAMPVPCTEKASFPTSR